ncbi:hypothetical protein V9L05_01440 [Bernardetia sp. Wsw4-3y2]|uniref:hypothetical protein n=1 Tax=Bernardetia sp. Wsw4-3y2 TaxID=3127471 RepID=UPI0030CAA8E9
MQTTFERLNETGQKIAGFAFVCALLWLVLIAQIFFSFVEGVLNRPKEPETQANASWVKPITAQEEKQKVKSFWSLKLTFEEGGQDE